MAGFNRAQQRFNFHGLDLNNPVDHVSADCYPFFKNIRSYTAGQIQSRVGLTALYTISANQTPARSFRRLNGVNSSQWVRLVKAGTVLAGERSGATGSTSDLVTGLSSNPICMIPYRPEQSIDAWMIFADSNKLGKIRENGQTVHQLGYDAPLTGNAANGAALPSPAIAAPKHKEVDYIEYANDAALQAKWAQTGVAGLPTLTPSKRINTTTNFVLFDSGTSGWACIEPTSAVAQGLADMTVGSILVIGAEAGIYIQEIHRSSGSTTYTPATNAVVYDDGSVGGSGKVCAIQLGTPTTDIEPNSLLYFTDGLGHNEYVRCLSVTVGKNGLSSIRCATTIAWGSGGFGPPTIYIKSCFRAYLGAGHTTGTAGTGAENVTSEAMRTTTTGAGSGYLTNSTATDLSAIATGLPLRDDDLLCLSMRVDVLTNLTSIRFEFDIDATAANQDFQHNALVVEIRPSDIQQAITGAATLLDTQTTIQRNRLIDHPPHGPLNLIDITDTSNVIDRGSTDEPPTTPGTSTTDPTDASSSGQTGSGNSQWSTIQWRIGDLTRVGTDKSRSLRNVAKFRVNITGTAAVTVDIDSWFVRGGYNPNTRGELLPYYYAYVARSSLTGATSGMSPASRTPVFPERQQVVVTLSQYFQNGLASTECDKLDVYRYGGATLGWHYVGTTDNGASPSFTDNFAEDIIVQNPAPPNVWRPWPIIQAPASGTVNYVGGTSLQSVNAFNILWAPGTEIILGGIVHTISRVISANVLELLDSADATFGTSFEIKEPVLLGQPLPIIAEWAAPSEALIYLACGDPKNPGRLYYSNGNNADGTQIFNYIDITSGSEPLQNIAIYNGKPIVFSTRRAFTVHEGPNQLIASELPIGRGLFARWAMAVGDYVYFLAADGIYATAGGEAKNLTADRLGPLFPVIEGAAGSDVTVAGSATISSPAMTAANAPNMQLSLCNGGRYLFFDYANGSGKYRTLMLDLQTGSWHYDTYGPGGADAGVTFHADEESPGSLHNISTVAGGSDATTAKLYSVSGNDDAGTVIPCQVRTPSMDMGDPRMRKRFGDLSVEVNANGATITVTPGFDSHSTTLAGTVLATTAARVQTQIDFNAGEGQRAKNLSLDLTWNATTAQLPILYFWEPSWLDRPVGTLKRATDYDQFGQPICKWLKGIYLEADTFNVARTGTLRSDEGVTVLSLTSIQHNGKSTKYYSLATPVYCYELSLILTDTNEWDFYGFEPDWEPAPPLSSGPGDWDDLGHPGAKFIQGLIIEGDTANAAVNVAVQVDEGATQTTIQAGANQGPVQMNGRAQKAYSFDTPFIAHLVRLDPSVAMRMGKPWKTRWIWEPEPELATHYETQQTSHELSGFQQLMDGYVTVMSTATVTLQVYVDGSASPVAAVPISATNTGGLRQKVYFRFPATKGKSFRYVLSSTAGFRLYQKDCEVRVRSWSGLNLYTRRSNYASYNPFGSEHYLSGARI